MRVASKFSVGFALALLPLVGVLVYIVGQVDRLATANRTLATVQFTAANQSLQLIRQLELVGEYAGKYAVSGDVRYVERVAEVERQVRAVLTTLAALPLSERERRQAQAFSAAWEVFHAQLDRETAAIAGGAPREDALAPALQRIEGLRERAHAIVRATRETIDGQARAAAEVSAYSERMSLVVASVATLVSLLVFIITFRAIHRPIKRLAEGTRAVARGQFSFQIQERGSDELAELSRAFNSMVRSIWKLLRMKSEFVSHVSHELKTPLVSMHETSQLLLDEIPGALNDKQRRLLELNLAASRRLSAMITDLLELSRAERGLRAAPRRHDLIDLVEQATAELELRAADREVYVILRFPVKTLPVVCDGDRIIQVVQNLLDNALKFTPAGGTIEVRGGLAGEDVVPPGIREALATDVAKRFALLEIDDSGPGLADSERERIFERFYQSHGGERGGVGLGLAICREIVTAHGGVIWATRGTLGGACFAVVLPFASIESNSLSQTPLEPRS